MVYTFFIILSGSVATLLLDIDKIMLNQYIKLKNIAYYSVATYIALSYFSSQSRCIKSFIR
jgi:O-antigen/teichoic acid export membrane protein